MLAVAPVNVTIESVLPSVLRTLAYADVFDYPLTFAEAHHYLIGEGSRAEVREAMEAACRTGAVSRQGGLFCLSDRIEIARLRAERERSSAQLWPRAQRWGAVIASLPFVRMVAVTGALAMNNVIAANDDVDLLIVTAPRRVWLARALCIGVVRAHPHLLLFTGASATRARPGLQNHQSSVIVTFQPTRFHGSLPASLPAPLSRAGAT